MTVAPVPLDESRSLEEEAIIAQESGELAQWRRKLLPIMASVLVALSVLFAGVGIWQLHSLESILADSAQGNVDSLFAQVETAARQNRVRLPANYVAIRAATALESDALTRRYHHANVVVASRAWTRGMGFVTGMIMALVGAAFVLGRLDSAESRLDGAGGGVRMALASSSPGLVLAALGTLLMICTITTRVETDVHDTAIYSGLLWPSPGEGASTAGPVRAVDGLVDEISPGDSISQLTGNRAIPAERPKR